MMNLPNVQQLQGDAGLQMSRSSKALFLKLGVFDMRSAEWITGRARDPNDPGVSR
jgi:hypothetical protein